MALSRTNPELTHSYPSPDEMAYQKICKGCKEESVEKLDYDFCPNCWHELCEDQFYRWGEPKHA